MGGGGPTLVQISVEVTTMSTPDVWVLEFGTGQLAGMPPLTTSQVYPDAVPSLLLSPGRPELQVSQSLGNGCSPTTGQFQIEAMDLSFGTLHAFTATFFESCGAGVPGFGGCVHFEQ